MVLRVAEGEVRSECSIEGRIDEPDGVSPGVGKGDFWRIVAVEEDVEEAIEARETWREEVPSYGVPGVALGVMNIDAGRGIADLEGVFMDVNGFVWVTDSLGRVDFVRISWGVDGGAVELG